MGAADVYLLGPRRILRDLVDIGHSGQVDDHVAALDSGVDGVRVAEVAESVLERVAVHVRRDDEIEVSRLVARRQHTVDDVRADEAGPAGDEHFHCSDSSPAEG